MTTSTKANFAGHKKLYNASVGDEGQVPRSRQAPCDHCGLSSVEMDGSDRKPFKVRKLDGLLDISNKICH